MSDPVPARTFALLLAELEEGDLAHDLTEAVQDLIAELEDVRIAQRGKPSGSISITLNFSDDDGIIEVKSAFSVTKPKRKRAKSIYWPTADHHLSRQNPRQHSMEFHDVNRRDRVIDAG